MSAAQWTTDILLYTMLALTFFCCIALLVVRNYFNRLHYLGPVTSVSITLLVLAVSLKAGFSQSLIKVLLIWFVLVLSNAILTHATARAARVRELGHWSPDPTEQIPGTGEKR